MSMTARRSVPCWSRLRARLRRLPAMARTIGTMSTVRSASVIRMRRSLCRRVLRAVPSATAETAPTKRDQHLQLIAERGRMGWQRVSGYNWRALVEADIGRYKRVMGDALRSRTEGRQTTEVAIAIATLNRMLARDKLDPRGLIEQESDAGLGNGGLGR